MAGASVGSMTLPWVIGQTFVAIGPQTMTWLVAAVLVFGATIFLLAVLRSVPIIGNAAVEGRQSK
jgi:hypothetical protein